MQTKIELNMKTFGELKIGSNVYSLNCKEYGVLTTHKVSNIRHIGNRVELTIENYGWDGDETLVIQKHINSAIGKIAPSIEGVKKYWIDYQNELKDRVSNEIQKLTSQLNNIQKDIDIIKTI